MDIGTKAPGNNSLCLQQNKPPYISLVCSSPQHFTILFFHYSSIDVKLCLLGTWQGVLLFRRPVSLTKGTYFPKKGICKNSALLSVRNSVKTWAGFVIHRVSESRCALSLWHCHLFFKHPPTRWVSATHTGQAVCFPCRSSCIQ